MIHTKRVIFMILPLLFVPLVYGMSYTPNVCSVPRDEGFGHPNASCFTEALDTPGSYATTCCWTEGQICDYDPTTRTHGDCGEKFPVDAPPPVNDRLPPEVLENLPTLEQVPSTPSPLFGETPSRGIEQPLLLQHHQLQVVVQMFQLKEGLQNNHLRPRMTKMTTKEGDYLLSKTRRMSH
jgi:hypothetical protein